MVIERRLSGGERFEIEVVFKIWNTFYNSMNNMYELLEAQLLINLKFLT